MCFWNAITAAEEAEKLDRVESESNQLEALEKKDLAEAQMKSVGCRFPVSPVAHLLWKDFSWMVQGFYHPKPAPLFFFLLFFSD